MSSFKHLAIEDPKHLTFGFSPKPLATRRGLALGGGVVYPEICLLVPSTCSDPVKLNEGTRQFRNQISSVLKRVSELAVPGLVVQCAVRSETPEDLSPTLELTNILLDSLEEVEVKSGLKTVSNLTVIDTRDENRPSAMRSGQSLDCMLTLFDAVAEAGVELLSSESVGGHSAHRDAIEAMDIRQIIFALCVLGTRDMRFLWTNVKRIADRHQVHASGDSACRFGNDAMTLAERDKIPRVLAAVIRSISAVRSLTAYECGAVGPGKSCGCENVILKSITGYPMSMEGGSAGCAHVSAVGNVAAAACDVWSNGSALDNGPLDGEDSSSAIEQIVYNVRLLNQAIVDGPVAASMLKRWLVRSDVALDPQALILAPESAVQIASAIVSEPNDYRAGVAAGLIAIDLISDAHQNQQLRLSDRDILWLDSIRNALYDLPEDEQVFIDDMMDIVDTTKFCLTDYDLN